jgi:hypothetical protein
VVGQLNQDTLLELKRKAELHCTAGTSGTTGARATVS